MEKDNNLYISKPTVARRYGVSTQTIDVWLTKPELAFPKPYRWGDGVRPRPRWRIADLDLWDAKNREPEGQPN